LNAINKSNLGVYRPFADMFDLIKWQIPVTLGIQRYSARSYLVADTRDAGHFMLSLWEAPRGESYEKALWVCGLVLRGVLDPEIARTSFFNAAEDASLL
jgi:Protein of unknown function (DUF982)